jgi:diphthamide biosynthesis methyltransferase
MAAKVKIWFDAEADFLEVRFSEGPGYMTASDHVAVMERVDSQGNVIGFTIEDVSSFRKGNPLDASLVPAA